MAVTRVVGPPVVSAVSDTNPWSGVGAAGCIKSVLGEPVVRRRNHIHREKTTGVVGFKGDGCAGGHRISIDISHTRGDPVFEAGLPQT